MFKQNEKAIAQIADYIPRACRGMQLQEASKKCCRGRKGNYQANYCQKNCHQQIYLIECPGG